MSLELKDEPDPQGRTVQILEDLDDMMTELVINTHHMLPANMPDRVTKKISHTLKWITGNLDVNIVKGLIDKERLEHGDAIKQLLDTPEFNVRMHH